MATGIKIDIEKLRGALHGKSMHLAEKLGIHQTSFSRRLRVGISIDDLNELCHYLSRDAQEFLVTYQTTDKEMQKRRAERDTLKRKRKLIDETAA